MKNVHQITDIISTGLTHDEAKLFSDRLKETIKGVDGAKETWRRIWCGKLLEPRYPHGLHQLVYYGVYSDWDSAKDGPAFYWFPSELESKHTNLGRIMEANGPKLLGEFYQDPITSFNLFQNFSAQHPEIYWSILLKKLSVVFRDIPKCILDKTDKSRHGGTWMPGATLNIAECCLLPTDHHRKKNDNVVIAWRDEGCDHAPVNCLTLKEFRENVMRVANALDVTFSKGDAVAIDMPMTVNAVIIYLGIILAGFVVVSIANSFAAKEIATRLRVANAKGVFMQDYIVRGGRKFSLYSRVVEASKCKVIVIPAVGKCVDIKLRERDSSWEDFLSSVDHLTRRS